MVVPLRGFMEDCKLLESCDHVFTVPPVLVMVIIMRYLSILHMKDDLLKKPSWLLFFGLRCSSGSQITFPYSGVGLTIALY